MAGSVTRLIICLALCFAVGFAGALATYPQIPAWYASLVKPAWTPPNWAFPVVWNILYAMMAVSLWLLWDRAPKVPARTTAMALFATQLVLNAAWSPIFFALHQIRVALVVILALIVALAATIFIARRVHQLAAWLLVPYLVWVVYAATLNAGIVVLNPN